MKEIIKKGIHLLYKRYHFWQHKKPRKYVYEGVYTIVQPTVFSPINTVSTKVFLDYISTLNLVNKKVLELGCGSGIISILSASKGAKVTASDINKIAVSSLQNVAEKQGLVLSTLVSDLFDNITDKIFDYIFINPPFYPKKPNNIEEEAWFCGENFDYFINLFPQLKKMASINNNILMILSDTCDLERIKQIAKIHNMRLELVNSKKGWLERNNIFKVF